MLPAWAGIAFAIDERGHPGDAGQILKDSRDARRRRPNPHRSSTSRRISAGLRERRADAAKPFAEPTADFRNPDAADKIANRAGRIEELDSQDPSPTEAPRIVKPGRSRRWFPCQRKMQRGGSKRLPFSPCVG